MTSDAVQSQYLAALAMLRSAVVQCPDAVWADPADDNPFWLIAYHAVFYTHLYVHPTEADFVPWELNRSGLQFMGETPEGQEPYTQAELLAYIDHTTQAIRDIVPTLDWTADSGFTWLPLGKLELQFYTIRHLQSHTGELAERLNARAEMEVDWVGRG